MDLCSLYGAFNATSSEKSECPVINWINNYEENPNYGGFHFYSKKGLGQETKKNGSNDAESIDATDLMNITKMPGKGQLSEGDVANLPKMLFIVLHQVKKAYDYFGGENEEPAMKRTEIKGTFDVEENNKAGWHYEVPYSEEDSATKSQELQNDQKAGKIKRFKATPL